MFTNYIGFTCPQCESKVNVGITTGEPTCHSCGTQMVPDKEPTNSVYTNVTCKKCGAYYGMALSNNCHCGEPFE